jgi:hypothetical protein
MPDTPNTRCTPILSLSPYPPPYQPLRLVSWGGVPPTVHLQTRLPHPKGGLHDERTKNMPYLSLSGGAAVCTTSASRGGLVTGCHEVACRPLGHLLTKRCRTGSQLDYSSGFVFVLFSFCFSSGVGTCSIRDQQDWAWSCCPASSVELGRA